MAAQLVGTEFTTTYFSQPQKLKTLITNAADNCQLCEWQSLQRDCLHVILLSVNGSSPETSVCDTAHNIDQYLIANDTYTKFTLSITIHVEIKQSLSPMYSHQLDIPIILTKYCQLYFFRLINLLWGQKQVTSRLGESFYVVMGAVI